MLIVRDYVAHMAKEVVKRLVEGGHIETKAGDAVANRVRLRMVEELTVEDRLNEEVRELLIEHQDEMRHGKSFTRKCIRGEAATGEGSKLILDRTGSETRREKKSESRNDKAEKGN
jgi:hypothetical protein